MAIFSYKARTRRGRVVEGMVDAVSVEAVASLLSEKQLVVVDISKRDVIGLARYNFNFFKRVKSRDLVFFFRQMSVMIDANLPIVRILRILVKQTKARSFKMIIAKVADEVEGGSRLSEAMADFPDVFGIFYINMIASGETSGRLSEVVDYLADQQEKDYDLQSKIRGAMIYPTFIVLCLVVVGFLVMAFVIPQITSLLKESGTQLPLTTRILITLSDWLSRWWWEVALAFIVLVGSMSIYIKTNFGRRQWDLLKIKLPVFGGIFKGMYIIRIARSFNTLLEGGVPVARSLKVVKEVVGNKIYKEILEKASREVDEGNPLSESLAQYSAYIPLAVVQMLSVGEETGKLSEVTSKISEFYSREVDGSVRNLSVLIEPIMMIVLGIAVGLFIMAVITPMWQLSASL
jgi:type IV pilus assembly protein PilC